MGESLFEYLLEHELISCGYYGLEGDIADLLCVDVVGYLEEVLAEEL